MTFARVLSLMAVLGWQLLAGNGALFGACAGGSAMAMRADCPCAQKARAERAQQKGMHFDRASCCTIERSPSQQAPVATASVHFASFEAPVPPPVALPRPLRAGPALELALRDAPRAQGPPVFLKVRSLLI